MYRWFKSGQLPANSAGFVFFMRGVRKGLRYPCWGIGHVMLYSIFEKWGGTIWKLPFVGCFTIFLSVTISHNMTPREGFTLF